MSGQTIRTNCTKDLFFWVCNFHEFIFLGLIFLVFIFWISQKNAWAEPPCHLHVRVHSLGFLFAAFYCIMVQDGLVVPGKYIAKGPKKRYEVLKK